MCKRPARAGSGVQRKELVGQPEPNDLAVMYLPVVIKGDYEIAIDLRTSASAGRLIYAFPTAKGHAQQHIPIAEESNSSRGIVENWAFSLQADSVKMTYTFNGIKGSAQESVPFNQLTVGSQDLPQHPVFAIRVRDIRITIKSLRLRMLNGEATLLKVE